MTDLALDGELPPILPRTSRRAQLGRALLDVINDLLDFSKTNRAATLNEEPFNCATSRVRFGHSLRAQQKGVELGFAWTTACRWSWSGIRSGAPS